jgi:two-component system chemotaxis response regulator CheB
MKIRVLIADDSPTVRQLLQAVIESDPGLEVIGTAGNGAEAIEMTTRLRPDVVIMDIHMPGYDGIEATREIMARAPTPIVIVSSALNTRNVQLALSATEAGALIALAKPDSPLAPGFAAMRAELIDMARTMSQVKVVRRWNKHPPRAQPQTRESATREVPRVVAVAASTGGPAALRTLLSNLPRGFPVPILVVQHIALGFGAGFADWLKSDCALRVKLADPGEKLEPGVVYVAPDDHHLLATNSGRAELSQTPKQEGFRPSANVLFGGVARAFGPLVVGVVLTGMGADGVLGLEEIRAGGGYVIAQDEASSIVYGMAREAVQRGVVDQVLSLDEIAPRLVQLTTAVMHG